MKNLLIQERDSIMDSLFKHKQRLASIEEQLLHERGRLISWSNMDYQAAVDRSHDEYFTTRLRQEQSKLNLLIQEGEVLLIPLNARIDECVKEESMEEIFKVLPTLLTLAGVGLLMIVNIIVFLMRIGN